jgi:hypothetical protein
VALAFFEKYGDVVDGYRTALMAVLGYERRPRQ